MPAAIFSACAENFFHAGVFSKTSRTDFSSDAIVQINVRDLMIRHGKNLARAGVENFQAQFVLHRQPAAARGKSG